MSDGVTVVIKGMFLGRNQSIRILTKPGIRVLKIKKVVGKAKKIPIWQQVLKYRGLYVLQNSRRLIDYGIGYEKPGFRYTLRLTKSFDNPNKKACYPSANFRSLYNKRKISRREGGSESKSHFVLDLSQIERIGLNGPLTTVLQYICPLEALFNTCLTSRMFYETVFDMFTNGMFRLTDIHLYILLGNKRLHISELLFIKLCTLRKVFSEATSIPTQLPSYMISTPLDLIQICIKYNFVNAIKYLYFERGMKKLGNNYFRNQLEECFAHHFLQSEMKEMFFFLTGHYSGFPIIEKHHVSAFLKEGEWGKLIELLKNENNPRKPGDVIEEYSYFSYLEAERKGKKQHPYYTLKRWKELENVVEISSLEPYKLYENPSVLVSLSSILSISDWELVEYLLCSRNDFIPKNVNFRLQEDFLNRDGFFEFFFKNYDRVRLEFSRPLFDLYRACTVDNDLEKVENIVQQLMESGENNQHLDFRFLFLNVKDILRMTPFLRRVFPIYQRQYVEALEKGTLEFVELFGVEDVLAFEVDFRVDGQLASEMVIQNLLLERCEFALDLYEGLKKNGKIGLSSSKKALQTSKIINFLLTCPRRTSTQGFKYRSQIFSEVEENDIPYLDLVDTFTVILGTERAKHSNLVLEETQKVFCNSIVRWNFESKFASGESICRYIFKRVLDYELIEVGKALVSKPEWDNNYIVFQNWRNPNVLELVVSLLRKMELKRFEVSCGRDKNCVIDILKTEDLDEKMKKPNIHFVKVNVIISSNNMFGVQDEFVSRFVGICSECIEKLRGKDGKFKELVFLRGKEKGVLYRDRALTRLFLNSKKNVN